MERMSVGSCVRVLTCTGGAEALLIRRRSHAWTSRRGASQPARDRATPGSMPCARSRRVALNVSHGDRSRPRGRAHLDAAVGLDDVRRLAVARGRDVLLPARDGAKPKLEASGVARSHRAADRRGSEGNQLAAGGADQAGHAPVVARARAACDFDIYFRICSTIASSSPLAPRATSRTMPARSITTVCGIVVTR